MKYLNEAHNIAVNPSIDLDSIADTAMTSVREVEKYSGKHNLVQTCVYQDGSVLVMVGPRVKYYSGMK